MSSANKVGEIFEAAGAAFSRLAELTMQLHSASDQTPTSGRWTNAEIDMLKNAVKRFSEDLNGISEVIKTKALNQMKAQAKRKAFEEANLPLPLQPAVLQNFDMVQPVLQTYPAEPAPVPTKKQKVSEDVTLNILNTDDVDAEQLQEQQEHGELDAIPGTVAEHEAEQYTEQETGNEAEQYADHETAEQYAEHETGLEGAEHETLEHEAEQYTEQEHETTEQEITEPETDATDEAANQPEYELEADKAETDDTQ